MSIEIRLLIDLKWKYFSRFWSFIEVGIIVCSWSAVGMYVWRYKEFKRIRKLFSETNGYVYINLQLTSYINNILTFLFGFCCFFGTIRVIKLCQYNPRVHLLMSTLQYSFKELISFGMMFSIIFVSFVCLFYLLFLSKLLPCSTFLQTVQTLFEMILMKFNAHQLSEVDALLGPFCYSLFMSLVVLICMGTFLSIMNDGFRRARENINNEHVYSTDQFLRWIGKNQDFNQILLKYL